MKNYRDRFVAHRFDPGCGLDGARADGFRSTFSEESRHRGLVREAEFAGVAEISELQAQLDERVRWHGAILHEAFAERVVNKDAQVHVVDQFLDNLEDTIALLVYLIFSFFQPTNLSWKKYSFQ